MVEQNQSIQPNINPIINSGFIYIRSHESYDKYDAYKLGKAQNCLDRESIYITSEIKKGNYELVLEVNDNSKIEKKLQKHFIKLGLHVYIDGGTEFFKKDIINLVIPYLDKNNLYYKKLSQEELDNLNRTLKPTPNYHLDSDSDTSSNTDTESNIILRNWQKDLKYEFNKFVESSNKSGIIIAPTGCGKSYMMIYLAIFGYIIKYPCDCLIMTKRKEILDNEFIKKGNEMITNNKLNIKIINLINGDYNEEIFVKTSKKNRIFIINTDKFIMSPKFSNYKKYSYGKIKLAVLDECHWSGADKLSDFLCWIKENVCNKLVGFSATPIRFHSENQINTRKVFSNNNQNVNIIYTRGYLDSIKDGDRVQTKWIIIPTNNSELSDYVNNEKIDRILNEKGFASFIKWLNNFITCSINKKGILWFGNKNNLKDFYKYIDKTKQNFDNLKDIEFIATYSKSNNTDLDTSNNLELFKTNKNNSILLAVFRATEGFDDTSVDFGFNLYTTELSNPLLDQQKEGRVSRTLLNKSIGYFGFLCNGNLSNYEDILVKRLGDWINYIKEFDLKSNNSSNNKLIYDSNDETTDINNYLELILDETNITTIKFDSIKNRIFNYCENFTGSIGDIKRIIQKENKKRLALGQDLIDTKQKYDEYAKTKENWILSENITFDSNNWVELLRPDFDTFKKQFYTWQQLKKFCELNKITTLKDFKIKIKNEPKIIGYDYIYSGFYNELKKNNNITSILYNNISDFEL